MNTGGAVQYGKTGADAAAFQRTKVSSLPGWMALMSFVLFWPALHTDQVEYWFMMQVGMAIGFVTSYPVNSWLLRRGIKEPM